MYDHPLDRRGFLAWSAGMILALHGDGLNAAAGSAERPAPVKSGGGPAGGPRLRRLELQTHVLAEMRAFYRDQLEFTPAAQTADSASFDVGATRLDFTAVRDGSRPYYHFAFNIPENKLEPARAWLGARVPILRHAKTGSEVIHFEEWNAHSLFFYDPAGNLVELIARHTLGNAAPGPFDRRDILYASEIGFVPPDQPALFARIRDQLGIAPYLASGSFLGDEHGILIVIPKDILWIPEYKKAGMLCPTRVTVAGHGERRVRFDDLPFEIVGLPG